MENVKNFIFDLGGVIINISSKRSTEAFKKMGVTNVVDIYEYLMKQGVLHDIETGKLNTQNFCQKFNEVLDEPLETDDIIAAWNLMLLDIPRERIELIAALRQNHRVFLLSNTNEIHISTINKYARQKFGIEKINDWFDQAYFSFELGMRKPDPRIFQLILTDHGLLPEATMFIDDSIDHIETAKGLGLETVHIKPGITINDVFKKI